ncbi:MAG: hypothetical protein EP329_09965 [Deltaproteobacteria bacterium]|nr:MAG: hypothetical protein EP329_09965 [Deltaproteobacteria bacterium]
MLRILQSQLAWLEASCRKRMGADRWADVYQSVLVGFLERLERGWFEQAPTVSREAQVRNLLNNLLRNKGDWRRQEAAKDELDEGRHAVDAESPEQVATRRDAWRRLQSLPDEVRKHTNATRAICVLTHYTPEAVTTKDLESAAAHTAGGARMPTRPVTEARELLDEALPRYDEGLPDADWKRVVAEILRGTGPMGSTAADELAKFVDSYSRTLRRGLKDLAETLSADPEDWS